MTEAKQAPAAPGEVRKQAAAPRAAKDQAPEVALPPLAAWASDGPFLPPSLGSQWSPTFSKLCLTAE